MADTRFSRRSFLRASALGALGALATPASRAWAMGGDDHFSPALFKWSSTDWDRRPNGLRRMLQEVEKRTSVEVEVRRDGVGFGPEMFESPMLFMSGERSFDPWSNEQVDMLRTWLKTGGFLVVDSCEGVSDGPFLRSARRELQRVFPDRPERALPKDHVLYRSFYKLDEPHGRVEVDPTLGAYLDGDRAAAVISANDMLGAWSRDGFGRWEYDVIPGGERQREMSLRTGINLVMYALCVNYKDDQTHIDFILKQRKWRVD